MSQADIDHQLNILEIHRRNLQLLTKQHSLHTESYVPPHIASSINTARGEIARIKNTLRNYYHIAVADVPGDFDDELTAAHNNLLARLKELPENIQQSFIDEFIDMIDNADY